MLGDCSSLLSPCGVSLRDVVELALWGLATKHKMVPVEQVVREVQAAKAKDGAGKRHLEDMKSRLAEFSATLGARSVADIITAKLDDWLRALPGGAGGPE